MTFSPLATRIIPCTMHSPRGVAIDRFLQHHQAGTDSEAVARAMSSGSRATSSNYIITNEGEIWGVVPEELRAWTSGSSADGGRGAAWDRRSITVEVENDVNGTPWTISAAASAALSALMADVSKRYGFPLTRNGAQSTVLRHGELWEFFRASYPTACCGGIDTNATVAVANAGGSGSSTGDDMTTILDLTVAANDVRAFVLTPGTIRRPDPGELALTLSVVPGIVRKTVLASPSAPISTTTADATFAKILPIFGLSEFTMAQVKALAVGQELTAATGGSGGGPSAAQIAAAVDAVIDDEAIVAALQALDAQSDTYQADLKATLAKGLSGTITLK